MCSHLPTNVCIEALQSVSDNGDCVVRFRFAGESGSREAMKASDDAAAALQAMAAATRAAKTLPAVGMRQLFHELGLVEEEEALEAEVLAEVARTMETAEGPAGDRVKYAYAVGQMQRRWQIFLALHDYGEEPTLDMVKGFTAFMYKFRQRPSKVGRQGLGDSVAEMAQYILAQVRAHGRTHSSSKRAQQWRETLIRIAPRVTLRTGRV